MNDRTLHPSGLPLVLASNILVFFALYFLRQFSDNVEVNNLVLCFSNLLLGVTGLIFIFLQEGRDGLYHFDTIKWYLVWSFCYVASYFSLVQFPEYINLSLFIVGKSITPILAAFLSGDYKKRGIHIIKDFFPSVVLIIIAVIESRNTEGRFWGSFFAFVAIAVLSTFSQVAVRKLSLRELGWKGSVKVSFLNGLSLLILNLILNFSFINSPESNVINRSFFGFVMFFSVMIVLVQGTMLQGFKTSKPHLSALVFSTTVPITIIGEKLLSKNFKYQNFSIFLAVLYFGLMLFLSVKSHNKVVKES